MAKTEKDHGEAAPQPSSAATHQTEPGEPDEPATPAAAAEEPGGQAFGPFGDDLKRHFPSRDELLAQARAQTKAQAQRRQKNHKTGGTLLSVALVGVAFWLDPAWHSQQIHTAMGRQSQVALRDGSTIVLNSASVLTIERRLRTRRITLQQGEAAFTVARSWQPFIVRSGGFAVRDLSTAFTVRRLEQGSSVTVLEGAVAVAPHRSPWQALWRDADTATPIVLREGQRIQLRDAHANAPALADAAAVADIYTVDTTIAGAWRQGRLVFNSTPLSDVVTEIQRYRAGPIHIEGPGIAQLRLSGVYDIQRIDALLEALPNALPVRVEQGADGSATIKPDNGRKPQRKDAIAPARLIGM